MEKQKLEPVKLTEQTYKSFCADYEGICVKCKTTQSGCEPDARKYVCEGCDGRTVYGTEMLMIMGFIEFVDSEDKENVNF